MNGAGWLVTVHQTNAYTLKDQVDFRKEMYLCDVFVMKQQHQGAFWP